MKRAFIAFAVVLGVGAATAWAQDQGANKATWARGETESKQANASVLPKTMSAPKDPRVKAFAAEQPKVSTQIERSAQRAAEIAKSKAATPMIVNQAKAAIEAAKPNLDAAKARYEAELLEQFGFKTEAETSNQESESRSPDLTALVVFVSASVPLDTLRAYAAQLEDRSGALVFRGAPGGLEKLAPFAKLARDILIIDTTCEGLDCAMRNVPILIDPILFKANGVTQVPAVGVISKDLFAQHCDDPEGIRATAAHITYGDAALAGHLEAHARFANTSLITKRGTP